METMIDVNAMMGAGGAAVAVVRRTSIAVGVEVEPPQAPPPMALSADGLSVQPLGAERNMITEMDTIDTDDMQEASDFYDSEDISRSRASTLGGFGIFASFGRLVRRSRTGTSSADSTPYSSRNRCLLYYSLSLARSLSLSLSLSLSFPLSLILCVCAYYE